MKTRPACHPDRDHAGRGLCKPCHRRHTRDGTLVDIPRRYWRAEDLVAEADALRARYGASRPRGGYLRGTMPEGITWGQVAGRLGVTEKAIEKARARLRRRHGEAQ